MRLIEVCVDNLPSAVTAYKNHANRLEVCAGLAMGGLTPSFGLVKTISQVVRIPLMILIRPRQGDFCYDDAAFQCMCEDVKILKEFASGFVVGVLKPDGSIDKDRLNSLIQLCAPLPVTFHRAFDMVKDWKISLEVLIACGVKRILTSGFEKSALEGLPNITKIISEARGRIIVIAGGGINQRNVSRILGSGVEEIHASLTKKVDSVMFHLAMGANSDEYVYTITDGSALSIIVKEILS